MRINVGTQDNAFRIPTVRHEDSHVTLNRDIHLLQLPPQDAKERILGPDHRWFPHKTLQYLNEIDEIETIGGVGDRI